MRILDIRVGRCNRLQYWVITTATCVISYLVVASTGSFIFAPFGFYLNLLAMVRRLHDVNYSAKIPAILASVFLGSVYAAFPLMDSYHHNSLNVWTGIAGFTATLVGLGGGGIFGAVILFLIFSPGTPGDNDYGPEPVGLDFRTMVPGEGWVQGRRANEPVPDIPWRSKAETQRLYDAEMEAQKREKDQAS